jgi:SEC-C motif-containing protein
MRSRYTAYKLKNSAYLLDTWHMTTHPPALDLASDATHWLGLSIIESREHRGSGEAQVEFTATFLADKTLQSLHERSRFVCCDERWLYLDGEATWSRAPLPGRNDPCYCGSGRKFKKCCG